MKKLFLLMFVIVLLVGTVSAADWDNKLTYSNEDLKVDFDNTFLRLFETSYIGSIELKSHAFVDEVIEVNIGNSVVMYYDFNFEQEYLDGLGEPKFTDLRTGEIIERDWEYVYYTEITKDVYEEVCNNITQNCKQVIKNQIKEIKWMSYNSRDILIGEKRIGIMVNTKMGDYVDVVWTIAGKKVNRHASYEAFTLTSSHGISFTTTASQTGKGGMRWEIIFPNPEITLFNITNISKTATSTATTAYVQTAYGSGILGTATFVGDTATFNPQVSVSKDTIYYILADAGGGSRTYAYGPADGSYPIYDNNGTYISSVNQVGATATIYVVEIKNITFKYFIPIKVTLNSPVDNFNSTSRSITFNATAIDNNILVNVSLYLNGVINETNSSGYNGTYIFIKTFEDGNYNWTVEAFNDNNLSTIATTRTFTIDTDYPALKIIYPNETINYHVINTNLTLNWSINDTNLGSCWYGYGGTNTTLTCADNTTSINITNSINRTIILYANDTAGHLNSTSITWQYNVFENSRTLNTTSYQTQSETFSINVTANSSLSAVTLDYNGTEYLTTQSGTTYSKTFDIPVASLGNNSIRWKFTYAGSSIYSDYSYQNITKTVFTICNSTYSTVFLNVSFKDEEDDSLITASIPTSNFIYYLGTGTVNKTYIFTNNTINDYYEFCASPNLALNTFPYIQYKNGTNYPQRTYDPNIKEYSNIITNLTLYLLSVNDGIYVTFQVINLAEQPISNVIVNATREIDGEDILISNGLTDASGSVTFWLNPDFLHTLTFSKIGYSTVVYTVTPTQTAYTITMGEGVTEDSDYSRGITELVQPRRDFLDENVSYIFNYTTTSSYWDLDKFGFSLYWENTTLVYSGSSTTDTGGTIASPSINLTGSSTYLYMEYYYSINSTYTNGTRTWNIEGTYGRQFSMFRFFSDLSLYIDSGRLFGMDNFGKALLSVIILVMVAGGMSLRYGIRSDTFVAGVIFGVVLLLDYGIGFLPPLNIGGVTRDINFFSILAAIMLIFVIIREERI